MRKLKIKASRAAGLVLLFALLAASACATVFLLNQRQRAQAEPSQIKKTGYVPYVYESVDCIEEDVVLVEPKTYFASLSPEEQNAYGRTWILNEYGASSAALSLYDTVYDLMKRYHNGDGEVTAVAGRTNTYIKQTVGSQDLFDAYPDDASSLWSFVVDTVVKDHPEFYWYKSAAHSNANKLITLYLTPDYNANRAAINESLENVVAAYRQNLHLDGMTDWQKAKAIHDELLSTVAYADAFYDQVSADPKKDDPTYHNLVRALVSNVEGLASDNLIVCDGYSKAYKFLLSRFGVESILVTGQGVGDTSTGNAEGHMWNMVKLDGAWYYFDVTWDDGEKNDAPNLEYTYFAVPESVAFTATHTPDSSALAGNASPLYELPEASSAEHNETDFLPAAGYALSLSPSSYFEGYSYGTYVVSNDRRTVSFRADKNTESGALKPICAFRSPDHPISLVTARIDQPTDACKAEISSADLSSLYYLRTVGEAAFADFEELSVIFGDKTVETIDEFAFACIGTLRLSVKGASYSLPSSLVSIGSAAFQSSGINELIFAEDSALSSIGSYALDVNSEITSLTLPKNLSSVAPLSLPRSLSSILVSGANETYASYDGALYTKNGKTLVCFPASKQNFSLLGSAETVAPYAFAYNCHVQTVSLPAGVASIGEGAFFEAQNLAQITLPETLERIEPRTFFGCSSLFSVTIPASVKFIGKQAYAYSGIRVVRFLGKAPTVVGENAFSVEHSCSLLLDGAYEDTFADCYDYVSLTWYGYPAYFSYRQAPVTQCIDSDRFDTADRYGQMSYSDGTWLSKDSTLSLITDVKAKAGSSFVFSATVSGLQDSGLVFLRDASGNDYRLLTFDDTVYLCRVERAGQSSRTNVLQTQTIPAGLGGNLDVRTLTVSVDESGVIRCYADGTLYIVCDAGAVTEDTSLGFYANASGILFSDVSLERFGDSLFDFSSSDVKTADGRLIFLSNGVCLIRNNEYDGTSKMNLSASVTGCDAGLVFAYREEDDAASYYALYLDESGACKLDLVSGDSRSTVAVYGIPNFSSSSSYALGMEREENEIRVSLDGVEAFTYREPERTLGTDYGILGKVGSSVTDLRVRFKNDYSKLDENNVNRQGILFTLNDQNRTATVGTGSGFNNSGYAGANYGAIVIPAAVNKDGVRYTVVSVANNAFRANDTVKTVVLPETVTLIGSYAFAECQNLVTVTLKGNAPATVGMRAFSDCNPCFRIEALSTAAGFDISHENPIWQGYPAVYSDDEYYASCVLLDANLYNGQGLLFRLDGTTNTATVCDASHLSYQAGKDAVVNAAVLYGGKKYTVTAIGERAFYNVESLEAVTLPDTLTSIASYAFFHTSLRTVRLPKLVTKINNYVFAECYQLESVFADGGVSSIGTGAFKGCGKLVYTLPSSLKFLDSYAFYGNASLQSLSFPFDVSSVPDHAFENCSALESVELHAKITAIGEYAFAGCSSLSEISVVETKLQKDPTLASIGAKAFFRCTSLSAVTIPASVLQIGDEAFDECSALTSVTFSGGKPAFGENAFGEDNGDTVLYYRLGAEGFAWPKTEGYYATFLDDAYDGKTGVVSENLKLRQYGSLWSNASGIFKLLGTLGATACVASIDNVEPNQNSILDFKATVTGVSGMTGRYGILFRSSLDGETFFAEATSSYLYFCIDPADGYAKLYQNDALLGSVKLNAYRAEKSYELRAVSSPDGSVVCYLNGVRFLEADLPDTVGADKITFAMRVDRFAKGEDGFIGFTDVSLTEIGDEVLTYTLGEGANETDVISGAGSLDYTVLRGAPFLNLVGNYRYDLISMFDFTSTLKFENGSVSRAGIHFGYGVDAETEDSSYYLLALDKIESKVYLALYEVKGAETKLLVKEQLRNFDLTAEHKLGVKWNSTDTVDCYYNDKWLFQIVRAEYLSGDAFGLYAEVADGGDGKGVSFRNTVYTVSGNNAASGVTVYSPLDAENKNIQGVIFTLDAERKTALVGSSVKDENENYLPGNSGYLGADNGMVEIPDVVTDAEGNEYKVVGILPCAFSGCDALVSITLPDGVAEIPKNAFSDCINLVSVSLPRRLLTIGDSAFSGCSALTETVLPDSLESVGCKAFGGCSLLAVISIPAKVSSIDAQAFVGCSVLRAFAVDKNNKFYSSSSGVLYNADKTELVCYPAARIGGFTFPASVVCIGAYAFSDNRYLTDVNLSGVEDLGEYAFAGCSALRTLTLPAELKAIPKSAFLLCKNLTAVSLPERLETVGAYAFAGCGLSEIAIPGSVKTVGASAFAADALGADALRSVTFLGAPNEIGDCAFAGHEYLADFILPDGTETFGTAVLSACRSLRTLYIGKNATELSLLGVFCGCPALERVEVSPENEFFTVDSQGALYSKDGKTLYLLPAKSGVRYYAAAEGTESVYASAFAGSETLETVLLPLSLNSLGEGAFADCENLSVIVRSPALSVREAVAKCGVSYAYYEDLVLDRLEILSEAKRREFTVGDDIDTDGLTLALVFTEREESENFYSLLCEDYQIRCQGKNTPGQTNVFLYVSVDGVNKNAVYPIWMNEEKTAVNIELTALPEKRVYILNDLFDQTGAQYYVVYDNGERVLLTEENSTVTGFDSAAPGEKTLTVSFDTGHSVLTACYSVTVLDKAVVNLHFVPPTATVFRYGEQLTDRLDGVSMIIRYNTGETAVLTYGVDYTFDGYRANMLGFQEIKVKLSSAIRVGSEVKIPTFEVTVEKLRPEKPDAPTLIGSSQSALTVESAVENAEYTVAYSISTDGVTWSVWQASGSFTDLTANTDYYVKAKILASYGVYESEESDVSSFHTRAKKNTLTPPALIFVSETGNDTPIITVKVRMADGSTVPGFEELEVSKNGKDWDCLDKDGSYSFSSLDPNATYYFYVRYAATAEYEAGPKSVPLEHRTGKLTPDPKSVTENSITEVTPHSFTLSASSDYAYALVTYDAETETFDYENAVWVKPVFGEGDSSMTVTFEGLSENAVYYVTAKRLETASYYETAPASPYAVLTGRSAPSAPVSVNSELTADSVTVEEETAGVFEYRIGKFDPEAAINEYGEWQKNCYFEGLSPVTAYLVERRYAEVRGEGGELLSRASDVSEPTVITTAKKTQGKADVPKLVGKTSTAIELEQYSNALYSIDGGEWTDSALFENLLPGTEHTIVVKIPGDATTEDSEPSDPLVITTKYLISSLIGSPVILGDIRYEGNIYIDLPVNEAAYTITWLRDGEALKNLLDEEVHGPSYTVSWRDMLQGAKSLSVKIEAAADGEYEGSYETPAVVPAKRQSAPVQTSSISFSVYDGYLYVYPSGTSRILYLGEGDDRQPEATYYDRYLYSCASIDGGAWRSSNYFGDLVSGTTYTFRVKRAENDFCFESEASEEVSKLVSFRYRFTGSASVTGDLTFGSDLFLTVNDLNLELAQSGKYQVRWSYVEKRVFTYVYTCASGYRATYSSYAYGSVNEIYEKYGTSLVSESLSHFRIEELLDYYVVPFDETDTGTYSLPDYDENGKNLTDKVGYTVYADYPAERTVTHQGYFVEVYLYPTDDDYYNSDFAYFGPIDRQTQNAPKTPTVKTVTETSVEVNPIHIYTYSLDGDFISQQSPIFHFTESAVSYTVRLTEEGLSFSIDGGEHWYTEGLACGVSGESGSLRYLDGHVEFKSDTSDVWTLVESFDFSVSGSSHTVSCVKSRVQYSVDGENWQDETLFENLTVGTEYTILAMCAEDAQHYASAPSSPVKATTKKIRVNAPSAEEITKEENLTVENHAVAFGLTEHALTLEDILSLLPEDYLIEGKLPLEYRLGEYGEWTTDPRFTEYSVGNELEKNTEYVFWVRYAETDFSEASESVSVTVKTKKDPNVNAPLPPTLSTEVGDGALTDTAIVLEAVAGCEYKLGEDGEWQKSNLFKGLSPNTAYVFYVRYAETANYEPSAVSEGFAVRTLHSARSDVPSAEEMKNSVSAVTDNSISFLDRNGVYEYAVDTDGDGIPDGEWQTAFSSLNPNTAYRVFIRYAETDVFFASSEYAELPSPVTTMKHTTRAPKISPKAEIMTVTSLTLVNQSTDALTYQYYVVLGDGTAEPIFDEALWQDGVLFEGLTEGQTYSFYSRIKETETSYASPAGPALTLKIQPMKLDGFVEIASSVSGKFCYGATLSVDVSKMKPLTDDLAYAWYYKDGTAIANENGSTYLVRTADIGKEIYVVVTGGASNPGELKSGCVSITLGYQQTPEKPTVDEAKCSGSKIAVVAKAGLEYSIDLFEWISSEGDTVFFEGLVPETDYAVYCRIGAVDGLYFASGESEPTLYHTVKDPALSTPTLDENSLLSVTEYSITVATEPGCRYYVTGKGVLNNEWIDGDAYPDGYTFTGLTPGETYTLHAQRKETAENRESDVVSYTVTLPKYQPSAPSAAPTLLSRTATSITLTPNSQYQFRLGIDGDWQDGNVFEELEPNTAYVFYSRVKETVYSSASPASPASEEIKTDKPTPDAPEMPVASATHKTITVTPVEGCEYLLFEGDFNPLEDSFGIPLWTWVDRGDLIFSNLKPETTYTLFARVYETEDAYASSMSEGLVITTKKQILYTVYDDLDHETPIAVYDYFEGQTVALTAPEKPADNTFVYTFDSWTSAVSSTAVVDRSCYAIYTATYIDYTVTFLDAEGKAIFYSDGGSQKAASFVGHYGEEIPTFSLPDYSTLYYYVTVLGWSESGSAIVIPQDQMPAVFERNVTYLLTVKTEKILYTVTFKSGGNVVAAQVYGYGESILPPNDPEAPEGMFFAGWFNEDGLAPDSVTEGVKLVFTAAFEETPADCNHEDLVHVEAKLPTCEEDGNIECWYCAVCDRYYDWSVAGTKEHEIAKSAVTLSRLGHAYTKKDQAAKYLVSEATCQAKAVYHFACEHCGAVGTVTYEYGTTVEHDYSEKATEGHLAHDASCTAAATYYYTCKWCHAQGSETFSFGNPLNHSFTDYHYNENATCTANGTESATCDRCDATDTREAAGTKLAHVFDQMTISDEYLASPATCQDLPTYYKSCTCGEKGGEDTVFVDLNGKKAGHHYVVPDGEPEKENLKEAVHGAKAIYYMSCEWCGIAHPIDTFEYGDVIPHEYGEYVDDRFLVKGMEATCEHKATYYKSCSCGATSSETFESGDLVPHLYNATVADAAYLVSPADHGNAAVYYKSCKWCGKSSKGTSSEDVFSSGFPVSHAFTKENTLAWIEKAPANLADERYLKSPATCTEKAVYRYSCTCGETSDTLTFTYGEKLAHSYAVQVESPETLKSQATHQSPAVYYYSCSCGAISDTLTFSVGEAIAHVFDRQTANDSYLALSATCQNAAAYYYSCSCGEMGEETFTVGEALAHHCVRELCEDETYLASSATCLAKATYYYVCEWCDAHGEETYEVGDFASHRYEDNVCVWCRAEKDHVHTAHLTHVAAAEADCDTDGNVEYWSCSCGLLFSDEEASVQISQKSTVIPHGHIPTEAVTENEVTATCERPGSYDTVVYCDRCKEEVSRVTTAIPQKDHTFTRQAAESAFLKSAASCTAKAVYYYACKNCSAHSEETYEYGDLLPHVYDQKITTDAHKATNASCTALASYYYSCKCGLDGNETFTAGSLAPHDFTKQSVKDTYLKNAATCQNKAAYYYCCTACGAKGTETFEYGQTVAHKYERMTPTDNYLVSSATCTERAVYHYCCVWCGDEGSATFSYGEKLQHVCDRETASAAYKVSDATCTKRATYVYSCVCGAKGTKTFEVGDLLPHTYDREIANQNTLKSAATCTEKAVYCKSCSCGAVSENENDVFSFGNLLSHSYVCEVTDETYLRTAASCTHKASYYRSCSCGAKGSTYFEVGELLPHVYDREIPIADALKSAATCTAQAVYYKSCACGKVSEAETDVFSSGDLTAHVYDRETAEDVYLAEAATCTASALYCKSCVCGKKGEETFSFGDPLNHSYTDYHYDGGATCTANGTESATCDRCDATDTREAEGTMLPHVYDGEAVTEEALKTPATCTAQAVFYKSCSCGKVSESEEDVFSYGDLLPHVYDREVIGEAAKASDATCIAKATCFCSCSCGSLGTETFEYGGLAEHAFGEWTVTVEPSYEEAGEECRFCSVCDAFESRTLQKLSRLEDFREAVAALETLDGQPLFRKMCEAAGYYNTLDEAERAEVQSERQILKDAMTAYNAKAETKSEIHASSCEAALAVFVKQFSVLAAIVYLFKKKLIG